MSIRTGRKNKNEKLMLLRETLEIKVKESEKLSEDIKNLRAQIYELEKFFLLQEASILKDALAKKNLTFNDLKKAIDENTIDLTDLKKTIDENTIDLLTPIDKNG